MKRPFLFMIVAGLLATAFILVVIQYWPSIWLRTQLVAMHSGAQPVQLESVQVAVTPVAGQYSGAVKLDWALSGVYSDTLLTPTPQPAGTPAPPDLGTIDLVLQLDQANNTVSGHIVLDGSLIFTREHTIMATPVRPTPLPGTPAPGPTPLEIGPYVHGTFDGTTLVVESERIALMSAGRAIQRQFTLTGNALKGDASKLSGQYRETLWGYAPQPVTVLGTFTLQGPILSSTTPGPDNAVPVAVADTANTSQGMAVNINVLANDSDADGDALTITAVSQPQFGTATVNGQQITYTPNPGFVGADLFTYVIADSKGSTSAGSVMVTVIGPGGVNQLPTAFNDTSTTTPGVAIAIDVLANDADMDGDSLTVFIDVQPSNGTAKVENNQIVYTPNSGFIGTDSFTYIIADGKSGTATATVTVQVIDPSGEQAFSLYLPVIQR